MKMRHCDVKLFLLGVLLSVYGSAFAALAPVSGGQAKDDSKSTLYIRGNIFEPAACKINQNKNLDVDFKRIALKKIDGIAFASVTPVDIVCSITSGATVQLEFQGTSSGKSNYLTTNLDNLAIALSDDTTGKNIDLNTFFTIQKTQTIQLRAVPVKISDAVELKEGAFKATSTLVTRYL